MRLAIKFAYDGSAFFGSSRQPNLKTVEGDIIDTLKTHHVIDDIKKSKFQLASRTDARVSALGNVVAFDTEFQSKDVLNILNSKLNHCWFYGLADVDENFQPKSANQRWYRYYLFNAQKTSVTDFENDTSGGSIDVDILNSTVNLFLGKHDFKNFANPHLENTIRTIDKISVEEKDYWLEIDIRARSFLWHQVRRLVNAWVSVARGELERVKVVTALNEPERKCDFGLAPPGPLFLMDIEYDFKFEINNQVLTRTRKKIIRSWHRAELQEKFFQILLEKV